MFCKTWPHSNCSKNSPSAQADQENQGKHRDLLLTVVVSDFYAFFVVIYFCKTKRKKIKSTVQTLKKKIPQRQERHVANGVATRRLHLGVEGAGHGVDGQLHDDGVLGQGGVFANCAKR